MNQIYSNPYVVAESSGQERAQFVRRTYGHVALAVAAFIVVEALLVSSPFAPWFLGVLGQAQWSWLLVLGLFMGVSWVAENWARSETSKGLQYMGLLLCVVAYAVVFLPIIAVAASMTEATSLFATAGLITGGMVVGLTAVVVTTKIDFSFLRGILMIGGFVALGFIAASILFGFNLGTLFSVVMVGFASAAILYQTSNIFRQYRTDQHVAAALALFASIALLFFYVLRLLMGSRN